MPASHDRDPGGGEAEPTRASTEGRQEAFRRFAMLSGMPELGEVLDEDLQGTDPDFDPQQPPHSVVDDWFTSIGLATAQGSGEVTQAVEPFTDGQAVIDKLGHHGIWNDGA
jgi:hypothetical protein